MQAPPPPPHPRRTRGSMRLWYLCPPARKHPDQTTTEERLAMHAVCRDLGTSGQALHAWAIGASLPAPRYRLKLSDRFGIHLSHWEIRE